MGAWIGGKGKGGGGGKENKPERKEVAGKDDFTMQQTQSQEEMQQNLAETRPLVAKHLQQCSQGPIRNFGIPPL